MTSQMDRLQIKDSSGVLLSENKVLVDVTLWEVMNDIPMEIRTEGTPAEGYEVVGISTIPVTLNLVGVQEALGRVNGKIIVKDPVSIEGATENVTQEIDLTDTIASLESLRLVRDADPTISVTVQIEKTGDQTLSIPLSNLEVLNRPETAKMSLTISPADAIQVTIHADEDLEPLQVSDIKATVDLKVCEKEGAYEVPVMIELPQGYTQVSEVILVVTATAVEKAADTEQ